MTAEPAHRFGAQVLFRAFTPPSKFVFALKTERESLFQYRFDAADAACGGLFFDDFKMAEFARALRVRAAAHLAREGADGVRFDDVAVLIVEHADDALGAGALVRHLFEHDGDILFDLFVDQIFDRFDLFLRHGTGEIEVETEPLGGDVAALLVDVGRENLF